METEEGKDALEQSQDDTGGAGTEDGKGEKGGGDTKDYDALKKDYDNLEGKLGTQGKDLGDVREELKSLRSQNAFLLSQIQKSGEVTDENTGKPTDHASQLDEITRSVEKGDMSIGEALAKTARITEERSRATTQEEVNRMLAERDTDQAYREFTRANPEFEKLRDDGTLDEIKKTSTFKLHDDFSAFVEWKGQQAVSDVDTRIADAVSKREEEITAAQEGEADTRTVVKTPGSGLRTTSKKKGGPLTDRESEDSMLAAAYERRQREQGS